MQGRRVHTKRAPEKGGVTMLLAIPFLIASYTDIKRREIPPWLFPTAVALYIAIGMLYGYPPTMENVIGMAGLGIPILVCAALFNAGGGDVIMLACVGFIIGVQGVFLYSICMSVIGTAVWALMRFQNKEVPLAPLAAASYLLFYTLSILLTWR